MVIVPLRNTPGGQPIVPHNILTAFSAKNSFEVLYECYVGAQDPQLQSHAVATTLARAGLWPTKWPGQKKYENENPNSNGPWGPPAPFTRLPVYGCWLHRLVLFWLVLVESNSPSLWYSLPLFGHAEEPADVIFFKFWKSCRPIIQYVCGFN